MGSEMCIRDRIYLDRCSTSIDDQMLGMAISKNSLCQQTQSKRPPSSKLFPALQEVPVRTEITPEGPGASSSSERTAKGDVAPFSLSSWGGRSQRALKTESVRLCELCQTALRAKKMSPDRLVPWASDQVAIDRFQRDKSDPSVIVFSGIKRCQLLHSTQFSKKQKWGAACKHLVRDQ